MSAVALGLEVCAMAFIAVGAIESVYGLIRRVSPLRHPQATSAVRKKEIWVWFATWLLLALEFELAADVLRTAISPTWDDVGQLAAIAAIRTGLNYFLEKDIDKYGQAQPA
jgi:uncharacterized membrane protein